MTDKHPLEKFAGMTKAVTLPLSGQEVIIRKVDMDVLSQDLTISTMRSEDLMSVAREYSGQVSEAMGQNLEAKLMGQINTAEVLKNIRNGMLREAVIRPTLDQLRTDVYGGRADSSDLGMGPDFSYLVKEVEAFNAREGDGEKVAADFPEQVGVNTSQDE